MFNKKGVMWTIFLVLLATLLSWIVIGKLFFGGFRLGSDPVDNSFEKFGAEIMTVSNEGISSSTVRLNDGNVIIGFNSNSPRINFRMYRGERTDDNIIHSTFFARSQASNCPQGKACLCLCEQFELDRSQDFAPFLLKCNEGVICSSLEEADFPEILSCEELNDQGLPPFSYRKLINDYCGYDFTGGFFIGQHKTSPDVLKEQEVVGKEGRERYPRYDIINWPTFQNKQVKLCIKEQGNNEIYIYATTEACVPGTPPSLRV